MNTDKEKQVTDVVSMGMKARIAHVLKDLSNPR
jgi:hypothetical protein